MRSCFATLRLGDIRQTAIQFLPVAFILAVPSAVILLVIKQDAPIETDPARLAVLPVEALRDPEIEALVRAAFRRANAVTFTCEDKRAANRKVEIVDRRTLEALSKIFSTSDDVRWPTYSHPGLTYARVVFDGPYQPDFTFDTSGIWLGIGKDQAKDRDSRRSALRKVHVNGAFARYAGDILGLPAID